ncbi:MAG: alpha-L-rhamnosidase C-terminal domain-containing protein [Capsulimonadaceae bacterium]
MKSGLLLPIAALLLAGAAYARPPTVDPTYGLPSPPVESTANVPVAAGNWIWASSVSGKEIRRAYFRRTFGLTTVPRIANLDITGQDYFTLFVNGREVDESPPCGQSASDWQTVHHLNIGPYLTTGGNILAVEVDDLGGAGGLLARLEIPGQADIITDAGWKVFVDWPVPDNWQARGCNDIPWPPATVGASAGQGSWNGSSVLEGWPGLRPLMTHIALPIAAIRDVHPGAGKIDGAESLAGHLDTIVTVAPAPEGSDDAPSFVVDFGKEVAGRLRITGLTSGKIQIGTGESYEEATQLPWGGKTSVSFQPDSFVYTPFSAFRYAKLVFTSDTSQPIRFRVVLDDKYYPVTYRGSFSCSDPRITRIWYTGAYTAHLCMQDDIWDAPKRDRARWSGDLHVSGAVIDDAFLDKFLMEQTLQRLHDNDTGAGYINNISGYSCAWICTLADFHRHVGDYAFLAKQHDALISLLTTLHGDIDQHGLFANQNHGWCFVDWSPDLEVQSTDSCAATHMFLIRAVREGAFLLREVGDTDNASKEDQWADALTAAARSLLVDKAANTYGARLQVNAMAVYSGVSTAQQSASIYHQILDPDSPAWDHTGVPLYNPRVISPYYANYVLRALSASGHTEDGLRVLRTYWGGMLDEGATTFWEAYDPRWPKVHYHTYLQADHTAGTSISLCHGWSSGPTAWLTDYVLGVRPTSGGFKTVDIAPDLGDLSWAEGDVPTPHGPIHVRADKKSGRLICQVTLPAGVDAEVSVPGKPAVHFGEAGTFVVR